MARGVEFSPKNRGTVASVSLAKSAVCVDLWSQVLTLMADTQKKHSFVSIPEGDWSRAYEQRRSRNATHSPWQQGDSPSRIGSIFSGSSSRLSQLWDEVRNRQEESQPPKAGIQKDTRKVTFSDAVPDY
eukprot:Gregarina_sp_Poly_1__3856@NODE_214_length_11311_cov_270_018855_g190_i0_p6_GENE_NODE_214_length_11311_cov_270_018855_g190_i0NODE_214_length_11311_cov_270_018855_g190_i0_p6_ORF_typecomplete_len129_score11_00_NODE_214_length_11311_cov_270_018855_g190_i033603746